MYYPLGHPTLQFWRHLTPIGINKDAWLERCVEKTVGALVDTQTRGTLLFALSTLGSLEYDLTFIQKLISEEMMQKSPFPYIEHLRKQGARETSINYILSVLTKRFQLSDVQPVADALESIDDLDHLTELFHTAIDISSVEVFLQEIDGTEV